MAVYNINTLARQDAVLAKVMVKVNQARALNSLPALTLPLLAQKLFSDGIDGYVRQDDDDNATSLGVAYAAASPSTQATVRAQLGLV